MYFIKPFLNKAVNFIIIGLLFVFCASTSKLSSFNSIRIVSRTSDCLESNPIPKFNLIKIIPSQSNLRTASAIQKMKVMVIPSPKPIERLKSKWNIIIKERVDFFTTYGFLKPTVIQALNRNVIQQIPINQSLSRLAIVQKNQATKSSIYPSSFMAALDQARFEQKLILLEFSADWCIPCEIFKDYTLELPHVKDYMKSNYIFQNINIESFDGIGMKSFYNVQLLPTILLLDSNKNVLARYEEGLSSEKLMVILKENRTFDEKKNLPYL